MLDVAVKSLGFLVELSGFLRPAILLHHHPCQPARISCWHSLHLLGFLDFSQLWIFFWWPLFHQHPPLDTRFWPSTYMSTAPSQDDAVLDLTSQFVNLRISISGPASEKTASRTPPARFITTRALVSMAPSKSPFG